MYKIDSIHSFILKVIKKKKVMKTIAHRDEDVPKVAQPACGRARGDSQDPKPDKYYFLAKIPMNCRAVFSCPP